MISIDPRMVAAVWLRNLTVYRHSWHVTILPNFFEPLLYLLSMGLGIGGYISKGGGVEGQEYLAFIGPGLMAAAAMNGASFEVTYNMFVKMNFGRIYDAFLATPATVEDLVVGELLWAVTRALLYGVCFLIVLEGFTLAGYRILTSPAAVLLPLAVALTGAFFAILGAAFTARVRAIEMYSYYFTLFITPLFLFSGIFYPVSRVPHGEAIAWWTPLYHAVRLSRGLAQGPLGWEHLVDVAWLVVVGAALLALVMRTMRKRVIK